MPLLLKGSCRCNAVRFEVESHTPVPFMLCYCSICRKQQGGGGFAINLGADYETLKITGKRNLGVYRAEIEDDEHPHCEISTGERNFCRKCGSALWLYDPTWPELVHPFASAIDSDLPKPPEQGASHAEIQGELGRARHRQGRQDVRRLSRGIDRRLAQADEACGWSSIVAP